MFLKFNTADNASANLDAGINASTGTITVTLGEGAVFPADNSILTLVQYNTPADPTSGVLKFEKVLMTSRSGDILTVTRGYDGTTGTTFLSGDYVYLNVVSKVIEDIQDEVVRLEDDKLNTVGGLRTGMGLSMQAIEIDAGGNEVKKPITSGSSILPTEKIRKKKADGSYEDIDFSIFQSLLANKNFVINPDIIVGEDILSNDVVTERFLNSATITSKNIGDVAGNNIVTIGKRFSSGVSGNSIVIPTYKVGATENFNVRIVTTDGSGNPTTTLVDPNASVSVVVGSINTGGANTTVTFPGNFTCGSRGTLVAIQICQGTSFSSPTVNASQYYQVGLTNGFDTLFTTLTTNGTNSGSTNSPGEHGNKSFVVTPARRLKITQIVSSYTIPSGITITMAVAGQNNYTFVTSSSSTTQTLPLPFVTSSVVTITLGITSWSPYWIGGSITNGSSADCTTVTGMSGVSSIGVVTTTMTDAIVPSTIFEASEILKSNTSDPILASYIGFSVSSVSKGNPITALINGGNIDFSGLTQFATYYISDTAGLISSSVGRITNSIGYATSKVNLYIKSIF